MRSLILIFFPFLLVAELFQTTVVKRDGETLMTKQVPFDKGASGFVVHHITKEHAVLTNRVLLQSHDANRSIFIISPFIEIKQSYLPSFTYESDVNDTIVMGFGYDRALLIAPDESSYFAITEAIKGVTWVHPDLFATFLSRAGHPSPQPEDMQDFCQLAEIGLLYIYVQGALNTIDCQSQQILQFTPVAKTMQRKPSMRPFYSRVEEIDEAWFGKGSSMMDDYERFYISHLLKGNSKNNSLLEYISTHDDNITDIITDYLPKER